MLSINKLAYSLAEKLINNPEYYRVGVTKLPSGATVIDTGVEAHGGYEAGLMVTRIAMGGLGTAELQYADYGGLQLPSVVVSTDSPAIALFGAQLLQRVAAYAWDPQRHDVGESMEKPLLYYHNNISGTLVLSGASRNILFHIMPQLLKHQGCFQGCLDNVWMDSCFQRRE